MKDAAPAPPPLQHRLQATYRHVCRISGLIALAVWLISGCGAVAQPTPAPTPHSVPTLMPTSPLAPSPPPPASAPDDSGWQPVDTGAEQRQLRVTVARDAPAAYLTIVRLDPQQVGFHVGYTPKQPLSLRQWVEQRHPLALINGGFFSESFESTALVVSGGNAWGESYTGRGGMFAVDQSGGIILRSLADEPYDPAEPLAEAVQGWPMLVKPGGVAAYTGDDPDRARRSVVARDRSGRILLIACATSSFTLRDISAWLAASDLDIDAALNLDGGSSTGLFLRGAEGVEPFVFLPLVLLVEPKP